MKSWLPRLLVSCLVWPAVVPAQNVNVTVNATQAIRTVDERVFGANSVIWDGQASTPQTISLLQAAGLRTVRVPGGSLSDEYHWRVNKGLNPTFTWASHFGKFVDLISNLNANAMVTVNYGTGTPEEAAALVAYLNSPVGSNVSIGSDGAYDWGTSGAWANVRASTSPADEMSHLRIGRAAPLGARYFEIGNECYGTWETDQQTVAHDPTTYANRAQQYMAKMKAVDPTIKIGVVVVRSDENGSYSNWTPTMLARLKVLGAIPDFIIYHRYPQAPGGETDAGLLQQAAGNNTGWAYTAADLRQQLTTYLGAAGAGVEVVVTENNSVYSNPGKQSTSIVNGLYLADSIANVMKTEINGFMWWAIRNGPPPTSTTNQSASLYGWRLYGDYGMISTPFTEGATTFASNYYTPYPTYYAMKLLQYFARGGDTVVSATSSSNLLSVFAARRADGSLALLVLNKDPNNALSASIALTGYAPGATATVYSYGKPQDTGGADIATSTLPVSGTTFTASFGSYSMTVLAFGTATAGPTISVQPVSQTTLAGNTVTLFVTASSTPAPTYQWRRNGANITGATGSTLVLTHVVPANAGSYSVVVGNTAGSVESSAAVLAVNPRPIGDFDGNGAVDAAWQNPAVGQRGIWYMNDGNFAGGADLGVMDANWRMTAAADFNGDGKSDILWQNSGTGEIYLWYMDGTVHVGSASMGIMPTEWRIAAAADFNGDGRADILWRNLRTGECYLWYMNGATPVGSASMGTMPTEWVISAAADFNADGKPDLLWQNQSTGEHYLWFMNGATQMGGESLGSLPTEWTIAAAADFSGDGKPDILWQNTSTGDCYLWLMNGTTQVGGTILASVSIQWAVAAAADFDGDGRADLLWQARLAGPPVNPDFSSDGKPDILWQNSSTGDRYIWYMNGTVHAASASLGTLAVDWNIVATADFNGDRKPDILWENTVTGQHYLWYMNGAAHFDSADLGTMPLEWTMVAAADFNNDGKPDILWQNSLTGQRYLWYMNGVSHIDNADLGTVPLDWAVAATVDFNGDGKPDILWQNSLTGQRYLWYMNGAAPFDSADLGIVPPEWSIATVADFNTDGKPDILWQNTITGERYLWFMNGPSHVGDASLGILSTDWKIAK